MIGEQFLGWLVEFFEAALPFILGWFGFVLLLSLIVFSIVIRFCIKIW